MAGMILAVLAAVAIQLAGISRNCLSAAETVRLEQCDILSAVPGEPLPASRQLRSSRYRNGSSGRVNPYRLGSGVGCVPETDFPRRNGDVYTSCLYDTLFESDNFWTDFIISALPVRAGPTA